MEADSDAKVFTFNFVSASETIAIGSALPIVCVMVVALRFFTRTRQVAQVDIDDWLILGGAICIVGMGACLLDGAARKAMGYPTPPTPPDIKSEEQLVDYNAPSTELIGKIQFAFQLLLVLNYCFVKTSIVYFYRRIFVTHKNTIFDIITKVTIVVILLWTLTLILEGIFGCGSQIDASWGSPAAQHHYCSKIGYTSSEALGGSDLALDVIILALPMPKIWSLRMSNTRKIAVTGIFLLGFLSLAASIARLVLYVQVISSAVDNVEVDQNQTITLILYWSILEAGLALIAACLPTLSSLVRGYSLRTAVDSIRSAFPWLSYRSSQNSLQNSDDSTNPYIEMGGRTSDSSDAELAKPERLLARTEYVMQDLGPDPHSRSSKVAGV